MDFPWVELFILLTLTLLNGFFAGCEIAFVTLREGQLQKLEDGCLKSRRVVELARKPAMMFSACQIGVTVATIATSTTAAASLSDPLATQLSFLGKAASPVALVLVSLVITYITLVIGELVPKRIAMQRAETWARHSVNSLRLIIQIARPAVWLLDRSSNLLLRILGGDPTQSREEVTEEEIRDMLSAQENVSPEQRTIISGAFEIGDRTLREIIVPRGQVVGVLQTMMAPEAMQLLAKAGHSRAPVHSGDLDNVLGIAHVRDLVDYGGVVANRTRPATVLPESLNVVEAFRRMQTSRQQMALVVDEHGGVEGIITLEDLMEELVGEIYDEFDRDLPTAVIEDDGACVVPGSFPIHDLPDIGVHLPDGDGAYSTVAGYVLSELGHIPDVGEVAEGGGWDAVVLAVEEHAITSVRLIPVVPTGTDETLP